MLRSEAESHIRDWSVNETKVYYYRGAYPWIKEIVVLIRNAPTLHGDDHEFECLHDASTTRMESINMDELLRLLSTQILIFKEEHRPWFDYRAEKTGGCDFGCWAVPSFAGCHVFQCKLYKK